MKNRGITEHPVKRGKAKAIKHFEKSAIINRQHQNKLKGGCCSGPTEEPPKTQSSSTTSTQVGG